MYKVIFTAIILFSVNQLNAQTAPKAAEIASENVIFTIVEKNPEFVGGREKLNGFITANLNYPAKALAGKVEGKVFLKFIIEKDGSISAINILQGMGFECDEEAVKVVKKMPKWKAGTQDGKPVRVYFTMPISFVSKKKTFEIDNKMANPDWYLPAYRRQEKTAN